MADTQSGHSAGASQGTISGHIHHIPQGRPFADDLARGILALTDGPEQLADSVILLPNRRLSKAVRDAFLRLSDGGAQLLPRMLPIGDVDEDDAELIIAGWDVDDLPHVIDPMERQLYLSNLIQAFIKAEARVAEQIGTLSLGEIMSLARALSTFLDQVETADCDTALLYDLAGADHADHWSKILRFLNIVTEEWPEILKSMTRSDPVVWRNAAIRARAKAWQDIPPKGLVVVAGSSGSVPATQDLMKSVMMLDRGHLVLSGLDVGMGDDDWDDLKAEDDSVVAHPQYPLCQLLDGLGIARRDVSLWCGTAADKGGYDADATGRTALLREVMRPARQTHLWRRIPESQTVKPSSVDGLHLVTCYDRQQEADVIALAMREVLEVPSKTAALVTADLKLAEMVSDGLKRWDIHVAPSAGKRLIDTPTAQFMRLILDAWIDDFTPVSLLAMARHHLAAGGTDKARFRHIIRQLELQVMRHPDRMKSYQRGGLEVLKEVATAHDNVLGRFVDDHIITPLKPLLSLPREGMTTLAHMADIHGAVTEAMAATGSGDADDALAPWKGQDGYRLGQFLHKISLYGQAVSVDRDSYPSALMSLMAGEVIYPDDVSHPRLSILGTVEARMHHADLIILGGMNEGISPPEAPADPWMNQRMRLDLGLPHAHWRIGHAAHDAVMAMARPEVLMTRAERDEGSPAAPSRWIQRMQAVMSVTGLTLPSRPDLLSYAKTLRRFDGPVTPMTRPDPKPPLDVRPRRFSATQLDTLLKDPYAIYARRILKLKALPKLEEPLGAADRGTLIHDIFCTFIRRYPAGDLPHDALDQMMAMGKEAFSAFDDHLNVMTFWWQRFRHMAEWFVHHEAGWRRELAMSYAEIIGQTAIPTSVGEITVTATADRIDITQDGQIRIVDYKTGKPPSAVSVSGGRSLQLRVEAMLAGNHAYDDIKDGDIAEHPSIDDLSYWYISGKRGEAGKATSVMPDEDDVIAESHAGITALLEEFNDPDKGYPSEPLDKEANIYSDYKHLARVKEWSKEGDAGTGRYIPKDNHAAMSMAEDRRNDDMAREPAHQDKNGGDEGADSDHAKRKEDVIARATRNQHHAADPAASVWVSANAGTGKTRVLTTRILRILINGARISEVMAVTYTRAAAAEMRNRIYEKLADWAVLDESALRDEITGLGIAKPTQTQISTARRLFARLLDAPTSIRIETVHAFCQSVLRRFPFEAGIQPYFELSTELQAKTLQEEAIADVMASGDHATQDALARLAVTVAETNLITPVMAMMRHEHIMARLVEDPAGVKHDLFAALDCADAADNPEQAMGDCIDTILMIPDEEKLRFFAEKCHDGTAAEARRGASLTEWLDRDDIGRRADLDAYTKIFLTADMGVRKNVPTKALKEAHPSLEGIFAREGERLAAIKHQIRAIETAGLTAALYQIAGQISSRYQSRKITAGLMDYDDLIMNTARLLGQDGGASWVRYKLDEGITHLLVDEAQDTSPSQWHILESLAREFFTGDEEADQPRSLFSVGDYKQSIYSFQGARPELFNRQRDRFKTMAETAGKVFDEIDLDTSFRTVAPILTLVDDVIKPDGHGIAGIGDSALHSISRIGDGGFIEMLNPVISKDVIDTVPYQPHRPAVHEGAEGADVIMARMITARLKDWIGTKVIPSKGRAMRAGDVMILVRSRDHFTTILDRELRRAGLPVAGADRVKLIEEIAVMDLLALGQVMLLPEDDLSLASVLKSPLFGLDEDDLYVLAHQRGGNTIQQELARLAAEKEPFTKAHAQLTSWLGLAEIVPPSQFYRAVLTPDIMAAFVARMGASVLNTLSEFLDMARDFEDIHAPSLQKLMAALQDSDMDIKRESAVSDSDEIRIMTMHGAKGLEAPIVVLPHLMSSSYKAPALVNVEGEDGVLPVVTPSGSFQASVIAEAKKQHKNTWQEEENRLLYVAMTRAEDGLLIGGFASEDSTAEASFYQMIRSVLELYPDTCPNEAGDGIVLESRQTHAVSAPSLSLSEQVELIPPPWMAADAAPEETPPRPLSPSRYAAVPPAHSPTGQGRKRAMLRGSLTHRLLEILPGLDDDAQSRAAARIMAPLVAIDKLSQEDVDLALSETMRLISQPAMGGLFGPRSRAEVPISGLVGHHVVSGVIDRLVIDDDQISIIDFKTGPSPRDPDSINPSYIAQQGIYCHVLRQIWPDRPIRAGLIYTEDASLYWLDDDVMQKTIAALLDV